MSQDLNGALMQEQVQDAKVITFKKRRRKNSRRTKGHRQVRHFLPSCLSKIGHFKKVRIGFDKPWLLQLLTGLRITGVDGIRAPENEAGQIVIARE